jgi:hypothetical protein
MFPVALGVVAGACGGGDAPARDAADPSRAAAESSFALPVEWLADSGRGIVLPIEPPPAVWVVRVAPARSLAPDAPLPDPLPDVPEAAPPPVVIDPGLKPPVARRPGRIVEPAGPRRPARVELDVEVTEDGRVGEVVWAGGDRDPALIEAAIACARSMEFFPALRGETPVVVWCRQRFEFGR